MSYGPQRWRYLRIIDCDYPKIKGVINFFNSRVILSICGAGMKAVLSLREDTKKYIASIFKRIETRS